MTTQLNQRTRQILGNDGYGTTLIGFNDAHLELYAHKNTNIMTRGTIAFKMRVVTPKDLNEGEATMLARKATMGLFPWPPGEECLKRTMRTERLVRDPFTNTTRREVSESFQGCKWCREESTRSQGEAEEQVESSDQSSFSRPNGPAPLEAGPVCSICGYVPKEEGQTGRPRSLKQRQHSLSMHSRNKHKSGTA